MVRLYRAVSSEELADIAAYPGFRVRPNSLLGKWFAETAEEAERWGQSLYQSQGGLFHVIQIEIASGIADQMFRLPMLDQIGPARYAEEDDLALINQQLQQIAIVLPKIAGGP